MEKSASYLLASKLVDPFAPMANLCRPRLRTLRKVAYEYNPGQVVGGISPVLSGIHSGLHSGFSECPSTGSSQPLAGFYSTPVLISLRWHGGDADLIIVMVAGGSQ